MVLNQLYIDASSLDTLYQFKSSSCAPEILFPISYYIANPVLKDPAPGVNVLSIANGMVTLAVRPYSLEGIKAPIPHVVHINK